MYSSNPLKENINKSLKRKSVSRIIFGSVLLILPSFLIFIFGILKLGSAASNIIFILPTPLGILGIVLIIWGIFSLLKKNRVDDTGIEDIKKSRRMPSTLLAFLIFFLVLFIVNVIVSYNLNKKSTDRKQEERTRLYTENKEQVDKHYEEIYSMLQGPQKVVGVKEFGALELENGLVIHFEDSGVYGDENAEKFKDFARTNLIGNFINVVIPPKDLLILYLSYFPGSLDVYATIFFNSESMNEKFRLQTPEKIYKIMFN